MASSSAIAAFYQQYGQAAQQAAAQLGIPWQWVLAQWGVETGWATAAGNNPGNVASPAGTPGVTSPTGGGSNGRFATFGSLSQFVSQYVASIEADFPAANQGGSQTVTGFFGQYTPGSPYSSTTAAPDYASAVVSRLDQLDAWLSSQIGGFSPLAGGGQMVNLPPSGIAPTATVTVTPPSGGGVATTTGLEGTLLHAAQSSAGAPPAWDLLTDPALIGTYLLELVAGLGVAGLLAWAGLRAWMGR